MALIACKECKSQISDKAEKCPSCGVKIEKKLTLLQSFGAALVVFIIIMAVTNNSGSGSSSKEPLSTQQAAVEISSVSLAQEYDQNEARADAAYKDKILKVKGRVVSITKDVTDNTVITLNGVNEFLGVHAEVDKSEERKAINLQKGQKITIQCIGKGEVISAPMLGDCVIL